MILKKNQQTIASHQKSLNIIMEIQVWLEADTNMWQY
jgi:hypothetical protein